MKVYTLYCGCNIPASTQTVSDSDMINFLKSQTLFEGLTVFKGHGFWKGEFENSFLIEIATDDAEKVYQLAKLYQLKFSQESVGIKDYKNEMFFI